ncbi:glycosyltransferase [Streptomyces sp. NPDC046261]|uniref:glycosyltransferase n=1 Tax=Streptomyces sp. NPDC046261 TaxID=3157200 RepID=UPI0033D00B43
MRVLLLAYGSRGDVEPMVGLALQLRALGAETQMCAPPDFAELLDASGLPLAPIGPSIREMAAQAMAGPEPLSAEILPQLAAAMFAMTYDAVAAVAEGCDAVVATGLPPAAGAARAVAEKLGVPYRYVAYFPTYLPSPHHPPFELPGRPFPPDVTDNRALWDLDIENVNVLFGTGLAAHRASAGLPPVDNFRDYFLSDHPWLAADPTLGPWPQPADLDVVQTGAWIRPDERPLPADLEAFLDAGTPPVFVGFGSTPMPDSEDVTRAAVAAVRAQDRRVLLSRGWADLALLDDRDDCFAVGEVNQQALFGRVAAVVHHGGAGTTTTAARAGAPQVIVPQMGDQPYWAGRVAELGIGAAHDGPTLTTESLSAALTTALTDETRARAAAVAGTIRTDGATVAAKLLLEVIGQEKPPAST